MSKAAIKEPVGRKTYVDPATGAKKQGAIVTLAKIRAEEIWSTIKPYLDRHEIFGNRLVVAIYMRPEVTEGGIHLPASVRQEDIWQGTTGLVVQVGPGAFHDSDRWKFHGQKVEQGDWIAFRPSDGILQKIGKQEVRIIQDCDVLGKIDGPDVVS